MKKTFLVLSAALILGSANVSIAKTSEISFSVAAGWDKAKDGAWVGKDKVWYKLDKDAKVWWSKDGKKWEAVKDGMWQDKDGKWLKIGEKKLWWSADNGANWSEVPEWKWMGTDGKWYKFDKDWSVWVSM
jgi:hypothetical protein